MLSLYLSMPLVTPTLALNAFKRFYRDIPKAERTKTLTQGYEALAKAAHFKNLNQMQGTDEFLIDVAEFEDALVSCGMKVEVLSTYEHYKRALQSDIFVQSLESELMVALDKQCYSMLHTPLASAPSPYIEGHWFVSLEIKPTIALIKHMDWVRFCEHVDLLLDFWWFGLEFGDLPEHLQAIANDHGITPNTLVGMDETASMIQAIFDCMVELVEMEFAVPFLFDENQNRVLIDDDTIDAMSEAETRRMSLIASNGVHPALMYDAFKHLQDCSVLKRNVNNALSETTLELVPISSDDLK